MALKDLLQKVKNKLGPYKSPGGELPKPKYFEETFPKSTLGTILGQQGKPTIPKVLEALRSDKDAFVLQFPNQEDFKKLETLPMGDPERDKVRDKILSAALIFSVGSLETKAAQPIRKAAVEAIEVAKKSSAVQKLLDAIKQAKPLRKEVSKLQTAERAKRAGKIKDIFKTETGEAAHFKALGKLKGELVPEEKAPQFESLRVSDYRDSLLSKESKGLPSNKIVAPSMPKSGLETKVSPSLTSTLEPGGASKSTRYTSPSQLYNLDDSFIPTDYSKVSKLAQVNEKVFMEDIIESTGKIPDVRIKERISFEGKVKRYQSRNKDPNTIADNLGGRIIVEQSEIQKQIANIQKKFRVIEVEDFFNKPSDFGYKGVNIKVELPNKQLAEIQIHTPESVESAGKIHKIYEQWRNIDLESLTPEQLKKMQTDILNSRSISDSPFEIKKITQQDADELVKTIQQHPVLDDIYEKISATQGLQDIFEGRIPQPGKLALLEEVFGSDLIKELMEKRTFFQKGKDFVEDVINIPRSLMASMDASAHLRQGILLTTTRPKAALKASGEAFKETFNEKNFKAWIDNLKISPEFQIMKKSGLYIAEPDKLAGGLAAREERFMSNLAEKIPFIGKLVKASGRNYVAYLNKLRVDTFNMYTRELTENGQGFKDNPKLYKDLAEFVNTATGRGGVGKFGRIAPLLNGLFFSPRLIASRFNMLNPIWYAKQSPEIRKAAIKTFAKFVGIVGTTVALLDQIDGVSVETDPRSSDFAKIRYGNTRWDPWGGFQQWARVFAQIGSGQRKTARGDIVDLSKKKFPFETRLDVASNFMRGKLAPIPSLALELLEGQKKFGEELKFSKEAIDKITPLYLADMKKAIDELGPSAIFTTGIPAFFGVGVQTYEERNKAGNPFNI